MGIKRPLGFDTLTTLKYWFGRNYRNQEKVKKTLVINPGEACGYLTGKSTIAIIDLEKMEAEIITL